MFDTFSQLQKILFLLIFFANILALILFYSDKKRAQKRRNRIPEKTLLTSAFLFGGIGAWIGMNQFRHKTKHTLFKISVPITAFITIGALIFVWFI